MLIKSWDKKNSGAIPIPPATNKGISFLSGSGKPLPRGPVIKIASFFFKRDKSDVPFPTVLYKIINVSLFLMLCMEKGLAKSGSICSLAKRIIKNCPGFAIDAIFLERNPIKYIFWDTLLLKVTGVFSCNICNFYVSGCP